MKVKSIVTLVLLASAVANAGRPVWIFIGKTHKSEHSIANINRTSPGAGSMLWMTRTQERGTVEEVSFDCARWSVGGRIAPAGAVSDSALIFVCGDK